MNETRKDDWVRASYSLRLFDLLLVGNAQGLGLVDLDLLEEFPTLKIDSQAQDDKLKKLRHCTLSELWVIGAYELIRLVKDLSSKKAEVFSVETIKEIGKVKKIFEEVRTPLVKFKKNGRSQSLYSGVPWFTFHPSRGYGFKLYFLKKDKVETRVIYRITLSDSLLNLLKKLEEDIRAKNIDARN